jgi:hypothetical protein
MDGFSEFQKDRIVDIGKFHERDKASTFEALDVFCSSVKSGVSWHRLSRGLAVPQTCY